MLNDEIEYITFTLNDMDDGDEKDDLEGYLGELNMRYADLKDRFQEKFDRQEELRREKEEREAEATEKEANRAFEEEVDRITKALDEAK